MQYYGLVVPLSASDLPLNNPRNLLLTKNSVYGCGLCNKDKSACGCSCALWKSCFRMARAKSSIEEPVHNSSIFEKISRPSLSEKERRLLDT